MFEQFDETLVPNVIASFHLLLVFTVVFVSTGFPLLLFIVLLLCISTVSNTLSENCSQTATDSDIITIDSL